MSELGTLRGTALLDALESAHAGARSACNSRRAEVDRARYHTIGVSGISPSPSHAWISLIQE